MKNTYSTSDVRDSVRSLPNWAESAANCEQTVNLEIYDDTIPAWQSTGMNETSKYQENGSCNALGCTFATTYPWMQMTAQSSFDGHS